MMKLANDFNYAQVASLSSQLLELPFLGDEIAMYVFLPNETDGLQNFQNLLNVDSFEEAIKNLNETLVRVSLPRFKLQTAYSLKEHLETMGVKRAFTHQADLSGIDGTKFLHVSGAFHKAVVEVNEEGSEAAAATGIAIEARGLFGRYRNVPQFTADHPFAFFIRDKRSGIILFAGYLNKP